MDKVVQYVNSNHYLENKMDKQPHTVRNGLICAVIFAISVAATDPLVKMGFIDDWSYIKTTQVFAQTGHIVYNGWATAMLGWQIIWGALFIKLLGFSFSVVRLSTLFVAMATLVLFHTILLRFGVSARSAVIGTLTLGLSPLFMPMAFSDMSDIPGLFAIVLCLYLCQRAVAAESSKTAITWLCLAAASNVAGGTARQIAWLGALVMVPSAGWMMRKRRGVLIASIALWIISIASVLICMWWFARQPYSDPASVLEDFGSGIGQFIASLIFHYLVGCSFCLLLLVYPILIAWLPKVRTLDRSARWRIFWIVMAWGLFQWATNWTMPWLASVMQAEFAASRMDNWLYFDPLSPLHSNNLFLPMWARQILSLAVISTALVAVEYCKVWSRVGNKTIPELWSLARDHKEQLAPWQEILWLLGPFSLSYFLLMITAPAVQDRYLLPLMVVAIVCLLRLYQSSTTTSLPNYSVFALAVFALLAIGGTHDWFAFNRAELVAINEIRSSGAPRTAIEGGFEYDGWTQIEEGGHINNPRLKVPFGAFRPQVNRLPVPVACRYDFDVFTPAIHPRYSIVFPKTGCLAPSEFPPVNYRTWLPPFKGTVYIQKIPDSSRGA